VHAARDPGNPRWHRLAHLVGTRRGTLEELAALVHQARITHVPAPPDDAPQDAVARIAALFDHAVAQAPEASVAACSFGDPALLDMATAELVRWLEREALIAPGAEVLDLGCRIGRVTAALAPRCASVLGLDISLGMVEEARRRHAGLPNLRFAVTSGTDLAGLPESALDLVLAVDSFPYLFQAGREVAERHVADAARLLRRGGALAILNLSYRADAEADRTDAQRWAARHGFALVHCGDRPFTLRDGRAFVLRRT